MTDDVETLILDTIKMDYEQKQSDLSYLDSKSHYLLTTDGVVLGIVLSTSKFSLVAYPNAILTESQFVVYGLAVALLMTSLTMGLLSSLPRKINSELNIEIILSRYANDPEYEQTLSDIGGTIADLSRNIKKLIYKKGKLLKYGWILTMVSFILLSIYFIISSYMFF